LDGHYHQYTQSMEPIQSNSSLALTCHALMHTRRLTSWCNSIPLMAPPSRVSRGGHSTSVIIGTRITKRRCRRAGDRLLLSSVFEDPVRVRLVRPRNVVGTRRRRSWHAEMRRRSRKSIVERRHRIVKQLAVNRAVSASVGSDRRRWKTLLVKYYKCTKKNTKL